MPTKQRAMYNVQCTIVDCTMFIHVDLPRCLCLKTEVDRRISFAPTSLAAIGWTFAEKILRQYSKRNLSCDNPEAVFKKKRRVWDPMLELTKTSPYLIVDSKRSAFHCSYKGEGMVWGRSLRLVGHICICLLISGRVRERGREGLELTLCLRIDVLWSTGKPMPEWL